jgi:hypothetical protein
MVPPEGADTWGAVGEMQLYVSRTQGTGSEVSYGKLYFPEISRYKKDCLKGQST